MAKRRVQRDLKRHFEAILGRDLVDLSDGEIMLRESTGLSSFVQGQDTSREIGTTGVSSKACRERGLFSIGGLTVTGSDGKAEFLISEHHCHRAVPGDLVVPEHPVIFVATAQSAEPVFVTSRTFLAKDADGLPDLRVEIYTWEPGGAPAGTRLVKWFCQFPTGSFLF